MKNRKIFFIIIILASISAAIFYQGCGEDTINNNGTGSGGWHPTLNFLVGQNIVYTTDSLAPTTGNPIRKRMRTSMTINGQTTIGGQLCYPFIGSTYDSATNQTTPEAYYFRYDQSAGKYYQFGIRKLINPGQPDTWDLVGDFDLARGTSYYIGDINYALTLPPPYGTVNFTGPLNGKIADSTTITSTGNPPQSISCYRIEMTATISGSSPLGTVSATIILDYYLGYATPTGIVEIKLRPFSFTVAGIPNVAPQPGFDRKIFSFNTPYFF